MACFWGQLCLGRLFVVVSSNAHCRWISGYEGWLPGSVTKDIDAMLIPISSAYTVIATRSRFAGGVRVRV